MPYICSVLQQWYTKNRNIIYKQQFKTLQLWEQLSQQQQLWQLM